MNRYRPGTVRGRTREAAYRVYNWDVACHCATNTVEFPDTIYRIMIVEAQQENIPLVKGVPFADELQGMGGIGGENGNIFFRRRIEKLDHTVAALFNVLSRKRRGGIR